MIYSFTFAPEISNEEIATRLFLAAVNTENVFGTAVMRLDASFRFDRETRTCVIDGRTEVGRHIATLFVSYLSKEFGDETFVVERTGEVPPAEVGEQK
jgi:hypothetical protein